jgi:membrane protein
MVSKFRNHLQFLKEGIWSIRINEYHPHKAFWIKSLRIFALALRGLNEDKIQLRASALTLYSLLSVVPVLAMGFGIAKGFNVDKYLEQELMDNLSEYSDMVNKLISFAQSMLQRTQGGLVAGIGLAVLFYTVMKVFSNIESSFNDIWQVKKGRSYARKFSDYLSMMLVSPILIVTASATNVFIYNTLSIIRKQGHILGLVSPLLFGLLKILPYVLIITLFVLMYVIMPNTKVRFKPALIAGIIAGSVFQITQWGYIYFQVGVSSYNAIYGGFAAIPLFIVWLQISWLIILFGAKVAFATQNIEMYEFENETTHMSDYSRRIMGLVVSHRIIKGFQFGLKPLTSSELSFELKVPIRMMKSILTDLVQCRILSEVITSKPNVTAYQPGQYIDRFTIKYIMDQIDKLGENYVWDERNETAIRLIEIHDQFMKTLDSLPENVTIKDVR